MTRLITAPGGRRPSPASPGGHRLKAVRVGGQGSVAGSVRDFRRHVAEQLGRELGLKVQPDDVIETAKAGYRLNARIVVKDRRIAGARPPENARPNGSREPANTGSG